MRKNRKRIKLKYKKERVILSDVLPFEIPVIFSNRYFYRFLIEYGIEIKDNLNEKGKRGAKCISWNNKNKRLKGKSYVTFCHIIKLLTGAPINQTINNSEFEIENNPTIPFQYKITHKAHQFRELSIIHPQKQIEVVDFYDNYKELLLYYTNISRFSIRSPHRIAKYIYFKDKLHEYKKAHKDDSIEINLKEYEHLKTFFTYKKYTNIFRFYEDHRYQRAEKKYDKLIKFDISKCFDSIYTHSICWALLNKETTKDNVGFSKNTFAGRFDTFMQTINYNETNGILIGPEFSRIFAELILQQIDKRVEDNLMNKEYIKFRKDFECYRYVDDYFLFYNNDAIKDIIISEFKLQLKEFKLSISDLKTKIYEKPIITELSMAKLKVVDLLDRSIKFKIEDAEKDDEEIEEEQEDSMFIEKIEDKFTLYLNPNKLSAQFKTILKETGVEYRDILNYTLVIISRKINSTFKKFEAKYKKYSHAEKEGKFDEKEERKKYNLEKRLTTFILNILDFIFFLYTVYPKVNSTIKLTVILISILNYFKGVYNINKRKYYRFRKVNRDLIFKKIQDEISLILEKNKSSQHIQVETLYLLIILKELGKEYKLPKKILCSYFCCTVEKDEVKFNNELNCFSICVLLYYIQDDNDYESIKVSLLSSIIKKIESIPQHKRRINAEMIILLFDLLCCPYLDDTYKKKLLSLFEIEDEDIQSQILLFQKRQKYWFIKWSNIDLEKELNAKICQEVYA